MKVFYTLGFVLFVIIEFTAQDISMYYENLFYAEQFTKEGKCDSALYYYEKEFNKSQFNHTYLVKKALIAAKLCDDKGLVKKYEDLIKTQEKCPSHFEEILNKVDSIQKVDQEIRINKKNKKALSYYRKHYKDTLANNTLKYEKSKSIVYKCREIDSLNVHYLLNLIKENGYLGEAELGNNNYIKAYIILLHFDNDYDNAILAPIIDKALSTNRMIPLQYANLIDRHLYATTKKQKYWTWPIINEYPNLSKEEIAEILILRQEIGLWGTILKISCVRKSWRINNLSNAILNP